MLVRKPLTATIHSDPATNEVQTEFSFDTGKPLPWSADVLIVWCRDCFPDGDDLGRYPDFVASVMKRLQPALDVYRLDRIADGAATCDQDGVTEITKRERTWVLEKIKEGRFPAPLYSGNKKVWLRDEVQLANARIIAGDTQQVRERRADNTHRPLNRHERRKAAKV